MREVDADDRYDWDACYLAVQRALFVFLPSFSFLYSRWDRILFFDNYHGQLVLLQESAIVYFNKLNAFCSCGVPSALRETLIDGTTNM